MTHALLLNSDYTPLRIIAWERAIVLLLEDRVELVEHYVGRVLRSVSANHPWPAVVRLKRFVRRALHVRFNRSNVLARDAYRCQYCGLRPMSAAGAIRLEELTIDHVVPRAQSSGGRVRLADGRTVPVTCWENVVAACQACNLKKADRTPAQARMQLLCAPRAPSAVDVLRMSLERIPIPHEWRDYLPNGSAWRDYWTVELDAE